jgi:hypothetical protein
MGEAKVEVGADAASQVPVNGRERLELDADVSVAMGDAPDGLPLVLRVERSRHLSADILQQLGDPTRVPPPVAGALRQLDVALHEAARAAGIVDVGGTKVYRTFATVGTLLGDTLLVRALGAMSPLAAADDEPVAEPARVRGNLEATVVRAPITLMKHPGGGQKHVAVPLRLGPPLLAPGSDELTAEEIEPLHLEDLRKLQAARFVARGARDQDGLLVDTDAYRAALLNAQRIEWTVSAGEVGRLIAQLARNLGALHDEGRVHADVKPANTVVTAHGVIAIDPIGVVAGHSSPGATPGWAAPEQLLARPVLPATDVYPLGLMVACLLGAAVSGEERSFVVRLGGGQRRVRLVSDHDVFLDGSRGLSSVARSGWEELIRHALEFDPDDRVESAYVMADRIDQLLDQSSLIQRITLCPGPGILTACDFAGELRPAWVVRDGRGPCS